jgi:hypothetical protein
VPKVNSKLISGITNYPIGVGINAAGEITIADNHNNFNLSVFSQDGQLISALESKVGCQLVIFFFIKNNYIALI